MHIPSAWTAYIHRMGITALKRYVPACRLCAGVGGCHTRAMTVWHVAQWHVAQSRTFTTCTTSTSWTGWPVAMDSAWARLVRPGLCAATCTTCRYPYMQCKSHGASSPTTLNPSVHLCPNMDLPLSIYKAAYVDAHVGEGEPVGPTPGMHVLYLSHACSLHPASCTSLACCLHLGTCVPCLTFCICINASHLR